MFLKIRLVQDGWEREDGEGQDRSWRQGAPLRGCGQNTVTVVAVVVEMERRGRI